MSRFLRTHGTASSVTMLAKGGRPTKCEPSLQSQRLEENVNALSPVFLDFHVQHAPSKGRRGESVKSGVITMSSLNLQALCLSRL